MSLEHLKAIIWLRWRLTRNMFARAGPLNAILSILMVGSVLMGALVFGAGGFLAGLLALGQLNDQIQMLVWDGVFVAFLFVWATGLMVEIQRSESIDLPKLLHLPITLQQVFVFNFVASLFTPSLILFVPLLAGLSAGLALSAGVHMALLCPLAFGVVAMITAWTYCLRGWLAALMINQRKRRAVIVWMTIAFVLVCQLPNLLVNNRFFRSKTSGHPHPAATPAPGQTTNETLRLPDGFVQAHLVVPPAWAGYGAMFLKRQNPWPACGGIVGSGLITAWGLMRAYRMTIRFYQGADPHEKSRPVATRRAVRSGTLLVERPLPFVPEDTAALALATFRSLWRAPELKMALIMPIVLVIVLSSLRFTQLRHAPLQFTGFAATAAVVLASFSFFHVMANAFGFDRNGYRALVLLPIRRHHILLAKNLAFFPFVAGVALILLAVGEFLMRIPLPSLLAGCLQVPLAFMCFCLACNFLSVVAPYRVAQGSLQAEKPKPVTILAVFVTMMISPVLMAPTLIPPALQLLFNAQGWVPWLPVNFLVTLLMLVGVGAVYWLLLPLQGKLLQRREQAILQEVSEPR
jgi:hypothetical protein